MQSAKGERRRATFALAALALTLVLAIGVSAAAVSAKDAKPRQTLKQLRLLEDTAGTKDFWAGAAKPKRLAGKTVAVRASKYRPIKLNARRLRGVLARAPRERTAAARTHPLVISLPAPNGAFHRFALQRSAIMAPGLALKHPEIKTYSGRGLTDPTATIHADLTPLGFRASVRSATGSWYIDPYYVGRNPTLYASYYARNARETPGSFVERDADAAELSVDEGYYHASDSVHLDGHGFAENTGITITISDPEEKFASWALSARTDGLGAFEASFVADPDGNLDVHIVEATDGKVSASTSYQVVRDDDPTTDPPTGEQLRTYRLAMITDPGYAAFFGGPANVTAAKVALMNRVSQVYEDDLTIRLQLIADNDLLNLDTWDAATAPNGSCGAAACFTQSQVTGCSSTTRARYVIGQIIGASNYDIGHLALGQPGGGVANLGVVGRSNKAGGCTGIPTPVGDFYAVDYVAHEMGHQFSGNHTFNGNQLNCSGGNRSPATSVEPGSGQSVMAYAGICLTDDLQPHSDPYFSQRSQQEITTYVASAQAAINEVQTVSLRHFGGGNEVQAVTFGPGFSSAPAIAPLTSTINAVPSATSRGGAMQEGTTVTIATAAAHTLLPGDEVTISGVAAAGYNGTFIITAVPTTRSFQYETAVTGLPVSGAGTVTPTVPGASWASDTATIRTSVPHGRSVGDVVTIAGVGVSAYTGTYAITAVPSPRTFQYTLVSASPLANSGGGSATYFSPFRVRIGGADSQLVGGTGLAYNNANLTSAINAIPGFAGTATVTGAATTGFTITYTGAAAGLDVPNAELAELTCGGCFASVEETNHGGAFDSFRLNYGGTLSAPIVNGPGFTVDAIQTALQGVSEVQTVSLSGYDTNGDSYRLSYDGAESVPITRGQNNTTAGIAAALQGGNEQQQVTLTGFNPATAGHSFQVQIGGNTSAVIGNGGVALNNAAVAAAINAIPGFSGTVAVTNAGNGGFTVTFAGPSENTDVPSIGIVNLGCSPACTATVRENVKGTPPVAGWPAGGLVTVGGLADSGYTLTFGGTHQGTDVSLVEVTSASGVTGTSAETARGTSGIVPPRITANVAGFGGGATVNSTGFQVTFGGALAQTNVTTSVTAQDFTPGASGFTGETDKGGAVDNGGIVTPTGNTFPTITVPAGFTIPLRTPFALTGSATDLEGDAMVFSWEQNDRGGAAGTSLLNNVKTDGPLFSMLPRSAQVSATDTLLYDSPGENHLTTSPTRVFPDLDQILANNTNAETGACPAGPIAPQVPIPVRECFMEFLPTADYLGFAGVNAAPASLHFRFTARDLRMGGGGNSAADLTLTLAPTAGPFLVTTPNTAVTYPGGSTQTITWDKANTDLAPVSTADVKISLSTDGGRTYPRVLAASTPNDGSQAVTIPTVATSDARVKIEAVGNVFFDVSNANFRITDTVKPTIAASVSPAANASGWHRTNPTVTLTATDDADGSGVKSITYSASGAQTIASTTVNAATTNVVISSEGTTTLSFFATDNEGNTSDVGTLTIRLDKTAPEAYLRFDPARKDVVVFGRDSLSGTSPGVLTPSLVQRVPTGDRDLRAENRTYDVVDVAGNTLQLVHSTGLTTDTVVAGIQTLLYNGGPVTRPPYSLLYFEWRLKGNASDSLDQTFFVSSPLQSASATWRAKDNLTRITSTVGGATTTTTVPGMFLLRLGTNNGALAVETTP